jgi:hypothetical protein
VHHNNDHRYVCQQCGRQFKQSGHLRKHRQCCLSSNQASSRAIRVKK